MNAADARRIVHEHGAEADAKRVAADAPVLTDAQRDTVRAVLRSNANDGAGPKTDAADSSTWTRRTPPDEKRKVRRNAERT